MLYSTRSKLIVSFAGLSFLVCGVALLVGGQLLYGAFLNEAANRVRSDLNAAREIYLARVKGLRVALSITALGPAFRSAIGKKDGRRVVDLLREVARQSELDFAGMVTRDGKRFCHIGPDAVSNEAYPPNPIADLALKHHTPVAGTLMLSQEFLASEDPGLANRARMKLFPTRRSAPQTETEETLGMALSAAVPVFEGENLLGVLYGGVLLNRSREIVDQVCNTVFQQETYKGRTIGTAALFFRDIRISTNFLSSDGTRALGTLASEEVERRVLTEGKTWTDRAFVVSDWYITAYEPIEDVFGQRVGMLGIGVLEAKYADVRSKALSVFIFITVAGMACAVGLGYIIADKISRPVHQLIEASLQVTQGNLSPEMGPVSRSEIGVLQKTFKKMLVSFEERDERLKKESEIKLFQSEKQATVGKLAGGVAHEINNPLTGIITFTHMLLRRKDLQEEVRSDLETIAQETERIAKIVRGLLDFSRQTALDPEPTDVNQLVRLTLSLVENQALIKGVTLEFESGEGLPVLTLDRNQMQSVLLNIILNAFDATEPGDKIRVVTGLGASASEADRQGIEISCTDTGCGIPPENLDKLFDPFFTTKEIGQGTGLGLSVSLGIVQRHGGTIRVQSNVGHGSTFTIWLPSDAQSERDEDPGR